MAELRFGIQNPQTMTWPETVARWQACERLGFDSVWIPDHLIAPFRPDGPLLEAWTLLAALATQTTRVRIGVLVSCNTFRHPALLAKQAVTVDHVSGGRLELGLGAGWYAPEHQMFGIPLPEIPELVARYREAVEVVDRLLRAGDEETTYAGHYYQLQDAPFRPGPVQQPRPPLVLGAHGPRMLKIVAEHADTWNTLGTIAEVRERGHRLDEQAVVAGRDPAAIRRSILYVPALMPTEQPWDSHEAFADFVGRFREAGMSEFIFQPPPPERFGMVEQIAVELLPRLRAESGH